ncbi:hypothetical protein HOK51_08700 [Candidatus Woesearchaeota archaeon]|jgi:hypothetical protein|nr:hypothetical protein [Candidatus Woesearchaeota archaeon]MBT6519906.1 hypothetical protein [Candidatus Woesearchaeota archaeon]MBT7367118.1 hypothetical protein [Candidatus Woesearchaeota archaeon]
MKYRKPYSPIDPNKPIIGGIKNPSDLESKILAKKKNDLGIFRKLTNWYYRPKSFERSGKLYTWLGVKYFQKALMGTYGKFIKKLGGARHPSNYFVGENRTVPNMLTYESGTRFNEFIHTPLIFICGKNTIQSASEGRIDEAVVHAAFMALNFYCTILQRYNRARVYNTLDLKLK